MENELIARLYGRRLTISPEVKNLSPIERQCFVTTINNNNYRADNCFINCRAKLIKKICGCIPFYLHIIDTNETICNFNDENCLMAAKVRIGALSLWNKECNCLPDCEGTNFQVITTTLPFNAPQFNPSLF